MLPARRALPEAWGCSARWRGPQRDVVTPGGEWVQVAGDAPGVPGLQAGEVRAPRLLAAALDKERGDQPPVRVGVELVDAEFTARQPVDRGRRQRRRERHAEDRRRQAPSAASTLVS